MKRKYFVAFAYLKIDGGYGYASTAIERDYPIVCWEDIQNITDIICSQNTGMEKIVVYNWRKFEDAE